jgi:hypothetical protein
MITPCPRLEWRLPRCLDDLHPVRLSGASRDADLVAEETTMAAADPGKTSPWGEDPPPTTAPAVVEAVERKGWEIRMAPSARCLIPSRPHHSPWGKDSPPSSAPAAVKAVERKGQGRSRGRHLLASSLHGRAARHGGRTHHLPPFQRQWKRWRGRGWGDQEDAICSTLATNAITGGEVGREARAKGASGERCPMIRLQRIYNF